MGILGRMDSFALAHFCRRDKRYMEIDPKRALCRGIYKNRLAGERTDPSRGPAAWLHHPVPDSADGGSRLRTAHRLSWWRHRRLYSYRGTIPRSGSAVHEHHRLGRNMASR